MASKAPLFVVLASLALLVSANRIPNNRPVYESGLGSILDNLIDVAEQILLAISGTLDESINQIGHMITSLIAALDTVRTEAQKNSEAIIKKEIQAINDYLDGFRNKSKQDPHVLDCIEKTDVQLVQVLEEIQNSSTLCVENEIQKIGDAATVVLVDIKEWNNGLIEEEKKLKDCEKALIPLVCVKNVMDKLVKMVTTIPEKINTDAEKVEKMFNNLGKVVQQCIDDGVAKVNNETVKVYDNFVICVDKKSQLSSC